MLLRALPHSRLHRFAFVVIHTAASLPPGHLLDPAPPGTAGPIELRACFHAVNAPLRCFCSAVSLPTGAYPLIPLPLPFAGPIFASAAGSVWRSASLPLWLCPRCHRLRFHSGPLPLTGRPYIRSGLRWALLFRFRAQRRHFLGNPLRCYD